MRDLVNEGPILMTSRHEPDPNTNPEVCITVQGDIEIDR